MSGKDEASVGSGESRLKKLQHKIKVVWQIELDFPKSVFNFQTLVVLLLLGVLIGSALSVVYSSHYSRALFHELKLQKQYRDNLETEWGQLLLEQSALSAHTRVERSAQQYLNMSSPDSKNIKLVISNGR
ncbi:cell division protein FtsL [Litoribrevibacter euphylliae]|uniref:Cell division protein FtsL n=1 Tax=Litoribrevibacter euphylliae TaxID=1834034 RepID=A0ABV7HN19_9GAMM